MPKGKAVAAIQQTGMKLWPLKQLNKAVDEAIGMAVNTRAYIDTVSLQCMLHAEKHGDVMPAAKLVKGLYGTGLVVAALVEWFNRNSPVRLEYNKETKEVEGHLAKPDEPDYKPFNTGKAEETPALVMKEALNRAQRPITPFSIAFMSERIKGFRKTFNKALEESKVKPEAIVGNPDVIKAYIDHLEKADLNYRAAVVKAVQTEPASTAVGDALKAAQAGVTRKRGRKVNIETEAVASETGTPAKKAAVG